MHKLLATRIGDDKLFLLSVILDMVLRMQQKNNIPLSCKGHFEVPIIGYGLLKSDC